MSKSIETPSLPLRLALNPPVEYDGKSYRELVFDFAGATDKDWQRAELALLKLYKAQRKTAVTPDIHLFFSVLAAQLANVPLGLIGKLPRRYYRALRAEYLKACVARTENKRQHPALKERR